MAWLIELGETIRPMADAFGLALLPFVLLGVLAWACRMWRQERKRARVMAGFKNRKA